MSKDKVKKLFWDIANEVDSCSDTRIENTCGVVSEKGISLPNGCSVMFGLDDGILRIYDKDFSPLIAFTEESEVLVALKEFFELLEL